MTRIPVCPSTFHSLKYIEANPGCTAREFCDHVASQPDTDFDVDEFTGHVRTSTSRLAWIRSPYHSNMLAGNLVGSEPHPNSSAGRRHSHAKQIWHRINSGEMDPWHDLVSLSESREWAASRRNWIYRNIPHGSTVYRYWLTAKALIIIDHLENTGD